MKGTCIGCYHQGTTLSEDGFCAWCERAAVDKFGPPRCPPVWPRVIPVPTWLVVVLVIYFFAKLVTPFLVAR